MKRNLRVYFEQFWLLYKRVFCHFSFFLGSLKRAGLIGEKVRSHMCNNQVNLRKHTCILSAFFAYLIKTCINILFRPLGGSGDNPLTRHWSSFHQRVLTKFPENLLKTLLPSTRVY